MFQYRVKVRGTKYLWGGSGISKSFDDNLYLVLKVDDLGEEIELSIKSEDDDAEAIGRLKPGETFSIPLENLTGVLAKVADPLDATVECAILAVAG